MWANCKRYNQAGSPIWKLAAAFAEGFERAMGEWVFAFRGGGGEGGASGAAWNDQGARPWELPGGGLKPVNWAVTILGLAPVNWVVTILGLAPAIKNTAAARVRRAVGAVCVFF